LSDESGKKEMKKEELSLQKIFQYLEGITIVSTFVSQMLWLSYAINFHWLVAVSLAALLLEGILSFAKPVSERWRLIQILVQGFVMAVACALGSPRRHSAFFLVLGAKSAALLPRKQMVLAVVSLVLLSICSDLCGEYLAHHVFVHKIGSAHFYTTVITEAELKLYFLIGLCTVIFLGRTVVSERRSRSIQQALTREAESLAVDLERHKIALEIHERLGHTLASLMMQLELAIRLVEENHLERAIELTSRCHDVAARCLTDMRQAVTSIREDQAPDRPSQCEP
jgi:signal transduction histidine kinase